MAKTKHHLSSKFSPIQFFYYSFNWIVGFGFIAAMTTVVSTGAWSLLSFVIAAFLALLVMLVYARASQKYPEIKGGIYGYSKLVFGKHGRFFQGWNQLQEVFLLSAASPLFLVSLLKLINNNPDYEILYYALSLSWFIGITILGIFGLKFSKLIIFAFAFLKYIVIFGAVVLIAYLAFKDQAWSQTIKGKEGAEISVTVIIANILIFAYAFNGFNSLSSATNDVSKTNFKKIMMIAYFAILAFYLITFMLFLGIENAYDINGFQGVWQKVFGFIGLGIFIFGTIANRSTGALSGIYYYSRIIVPLVEDGYLPSFLKKKNKFGEYGNAMYVTLVVIILSMTFFTIIPSLLKIDDPFSRIVESGMIIYLNTYIGAFIIFLILDRKKALQIPLWEKILYIIGTILSIVILILYLFPIIGGGVWTLTNTVILISYFSTLAIGYLLWWLTYIFKKQCKIVKP